MKIKIVILLASLLICNIASGQVVMDLHDSSYNDRNYYDYDYVTDKYSYKFEGRWLYKSSTTHFEIVLTRFINKNMLISDCIYGWVKYVKNGVVITDGIQGKTFPKSNGTSTDPAVTIDYYIPETLVAIKNFAIIGNSTSEYVLRLGIDDKTNNRDYIGTMTMDPANRNNATMTIVDDNKSRVGMYLVGGGNEPNPDTTVYFPTSLTLTRQP